MDSEPKNPANIKLNRLQNFFIRTLFRLPERAQILLSGEAPIQAEGQRLNPEMQFFLALLRIRKLDDIDDLSPQTFRQQVIANTRLLDGPKIQIRETCDRSISSRAGLLPIRHYAPHVKSGAAPLLVYLHGGGFVSGTLDTHDSICRFLCKTVEIHVIAPDYRLAPEFPFPCALEDSEDAFDWALNHAKELGADPDRILIGGDSAGANLATVVAQLRKAKSLAQPFLQFLIYPATDRINKYPSLSLFEENFLLTRKYMDYFTRHYVGNRDLSDSRISPLLAEDLGNLAPALVISAAFDLLRDEVEAYSFKLQRAGTPTHLMRVPSMIHGFINLFEVSPAARNSLLTVTDQLRSQIYHYTNLLEG